MGRLKLPTRSSKPVLLLVPPECHQSPGKWRVLLRGRNALMRGRNAREMNKQKSFFFLIIPQLWLPAHLTLPHLYIGKPAKHIRLHHSQRTESYTLHMDLHEHTQKKRKTASLARTLWSGLCFRGLALSQLPGGMRSFLLVFWHFSTNASWGLKSISWSSKFLVDSVGAAWPWHSLADLLQRNGAWNLAPIALSRLRAFPSAFFIPLMLWIQCKFDLA